MAFIASPRGFLGEVPEWRREKKSRIYKIQKNKQVRENGRT
jgi:hypothetical protein